MTDSNPRPQADLARVLAWSLAEQQIHYTDQLHDYIAAQLAGAPYRAQFPAIALHLDGCVECAELYDRLYLAALAEQQAQLAAPAVLPEPDLTFLQPAALPTLLAQVQSAFQRIGARITLQLTPDLLPALRPALATAALRAPTDEARYHDVLLELTGDEWPLTLRAYRDAQQPDTCLVEVQLTLPDRAWPNLGDLAVTLHRQDKQRTLLTDAWGLAVFEEVAVAELAELQVEVVLE